MTTVADKQVAMRAALHKLAGQFLSRCEADLATCRLLLARLEQGDSAAAAQLEGLVHKISGTGASLGFERLSELAAVAERLAELQSQSEPPEATTVSDLADHIGRMTREVTGLMQQRG